VSFFFFFFFFGGYKRSTKIPIKKCIDILIHNESTKIEMWNIIVMFRNQISYTENTH
jgi:hypothetical protein